MVFLLAHKNQEGKTMAEKVRNLLLNGKKVGVLPFTQPVDLFCLHRALSEAVQAVGEQMERVQRGAWEGESLDGDHLWSRNDLEATGLVIRSVAEVFTREGLKVDVSFENEEVPLIPLQW
ncbi:MAG: hypothetical protein HXY24_19345, partial [Rubrivivax sp.]|nr:hypothetical protein [Rubrivivax sp.]